MLFKLKHLKRQINCMKNLYQTLGVSLATKSWIRILIYIIEAEHIKKFLVCVEIRTIITYPDYPPTGRHSEPGEDSTYTRVKINVVYLGLPIGLSSKVYWFYFVQIPHLSIIVLHASFASFFLIVQHLMFVENYTFWSCLS